MSDLTVVVVTHRSERVLAGCLEALPRQLRKSTLVVDNASDDATVQVAEAADVRLLRLPGNRGFAAAANVGAAASSGRLLCFLNPDCRPPEALWEQARKRLPDDAPACAVPMLEEDDGPVSGRQPGYTPVKLLADLLETGYGRTALVERLRRRRDHDDPSWWWPHGACLFVPRPTFERLGGFDERYFLYMEDVELGRRLSEAGGEVRELAATVGHARCRGSAVPAARRRRLIRRGRIRYARIHHGLAYATFLGAMTAPSEPLRRLVGRQR